MVKLLDILRESEESILVPRRSKEERKKNHVIAIQKRIKQYIANGSEGDLDLSNTPITSLPQGLKVGGDLDLHHTPITSLPQDLEVRGDLDLRYTKITNLSQGLKIGGSLGLSGTEITSLPQGLKVSGNLYLNDTLITSLPQDLKVGRDLWLRGIPVAKKYTKKEIKQMCPGIKGDIYI